MHGNNNSYNIYKLYIFVGFELFTKESEIQCFSLPADTVQQNGTLAHEEIAGRNLVSKTYGIQIEIPGALQVRCLEAILLLLDWNHKCCQC